MRTLALLLLAACGSSSTPPPTGPGNTDGLAVEIEVASVRLADDCPDELGELSQARSSMEAGDCAPDSNCGGFCEQTTMQLSVSAGAGAGAAPVGVEIVRVELVDADGHVIDTMSARGATRWDEATGAYVAWDGNVAAGQTIGASYALTAPDWSKVPGGRWGDGATYQARVTVKVGGVELSRVSAATAVVPDAMVVT